MRKVTMTLPTDTVKQLDRVVPDYKRSQAVHIAIGLLLAVKDHERDEWRAAFRALCKS